MLGSNPSADSVASTDTGGCYGIPFRYLARETPNRERHQSAKILGVWGQSPHKQVLPTQTAFLSRAPSHNACIGLNSTVEIRASWITAHCPACVLMSSPDAGWSSKPQIDRALASSR